MSLKGFLLVEVFRGLRTSVVVRSNRLVLSVEPGFTNRRDFRSHFLGFAGSHERNV